MINNHSLEMVKRLLGFIVLAAIFGPALAGEVRYVSDQLTLKMYKDSALSKILPSLKSGDEVEILKRDDGYMQVKLKSGTVGWVKGAYLVKEKPAILRVPELQQELDDLRSKHTDMLLEKTEQEEVEKPDEQLQARVEAAETAQQNMKIRVKELESERMQHIDELRELRQQSEPRMDSRQVLLWVVLPVLTLISGFFIGFKYLEGKVKSRFGGYNPL